MMTEEEITNRLDFIESRLAELEEDEHVCADGHKFRQGEGRLSNCIFCTCCGEVRKMGEQEVVKGFSP